MIIRQKVVVIPWSQRVATCDHIMRSRDALPFEEIAEEVSDGMGRWLGEFSGLGVEQMVATDNGSCGFAGFVTGAFSGWLDGRKLDKGRTIVYSCGPDAMLGRVADIAISRGLRCQVSLERRMGCGIGLCQSCAVECKGEKEGETVYKMCCKDGPVFEADQVVFGKNNV